MSDHHVPLKIEGDKVTEVGVSRSYPDTAGLREKVASEIETVGWAILQALHEGVEDGPQSWSDMASDQEKRIKKAAIAAIEAVTDLAQFNAQGFSWPPQPLAPALGSGDCGVWQPIETIPEVPPCPPKRYLLWSTQLGLCIGSAGSLNGFIWANVAAYHGNAIEHWGVTHWRPELEGPAVTSTDRGSK